MGGTENFAGAGIFLLGGESWEGVILTIQTFFKLKTELSVNAEHKLKSKLAWPLCIEYEIKTKMVQGQWLSYAKWSFY